jgi:double-strand break repair protein MRE11
MQRLRVFVTTDNHLGHNSKNTVTSGDSFKAFEEALQTAQKERVDLVILAGDLFDKQEIDGATLTRCIDIMCGTIGRKKALPDLIDLDQIDRDLLDPHSIPALFINGNHDAPSGNLEGSHNHVLEKVGIFKWIGKINNFDNVLIRPAIVRKGGLAIAVYGVGYIKDERLNQMLSTGKLRFQAALDVPVDYRILVVHQNAHKIDGRGLTKRHAFNTDFLPDKLFDLIIWGHEHESFLTLKEVPNKSFRIYQPGSTIPTKIIPAESANKHAGILVFAKNEFHLETRQLNFQRPMLSEAINFEQVAQGREADLIDRRVTADGLILDYVRAHYEFKEYDEEDLKPYIRFKLEIARSVMLNPYPLELYFERRAANKG